MITETNRKWWVLVGVSTLSFLGCIDLTIVNTAAPAIRQELDAGVAQLQLIVNIFIVALSMFMVTAGRLSDLFGRRRVLYVGAGLFGLASLGAGLATEIEWLIAFRFLQGAACSVLYTSSSTIVADAFPEEQRGRAIGALFGVNGVGLAVGPMLGGFIVGWLDWHWVFWINVPLTAVALLICAFSVRESRGGEDGARIDWPGLVLVGLALSGLIFGLTFNDTFGWGSWQVLGPLAVGVLALVLFVLVERRAKFPIIRFELFRNRLFVSALSADFALAFFYTLALFLMPLYLSWVRGYGELTIGLMMLPTTATMAIASPFVGRLVERVGPRPLLSFGFGAFALSAFCQSLLKPDSDLGFVVLSFALMGVGWAFVLGPAAVAALSSVPDRMAGLAVGSTWTFHNFGGAVGLALGMTVYRSFAEGSLVHDLTTRGVEAGAWTKEAVTNPDSAVDLLKEHGSITGKDADALLNSLFTAGEQAAMWLLVGTSLAALLIILLLGRGGRGEAGAGAVDVPQQASDAGAGAVPEVEPDVRAR
ncbi:MFS transporter [Streptomyces sp. NPDC021093]|uniref:MFS transporter n=1 Tax=Streptomyces sp. NPDC021093 TaxID=3365112 RepID=UPI0037921348